MPTNDPLKDLLASRLLQQTGPFDTSPSVDGVSIATDTVPVVSPTQPERVPPAWQRHLTGLKMQDAVRNNWTPNPTLLRILEGR